MTTAMKLRHLLLGRKAMTNLDSILKSRDIRSEEHTSELQSPPAVILEPKKIKSVTVSIVSPSICHEVTGNRCHELRFLNVEF